MDYRQLDIEINTNTKQNELVKTKNSEKLLDRKENLLALPMVTDKPARANSPTNGHEWHSWALDS